MSDFKYDEVTGLGDCFKVAANLVVPILGMIGDELAELVDVTLVHGIVTGQGLLDGVRYTHAWVEGYTPEGIPMVVDASNGRHVVMPQGLYYLIGRIEESECVRYTSDEAHDRMLDYAHYGPWDGAPAAHPEPNLDDLNHQIENRQEVA